MDTKIQTNELSDKSVTLADVNIKMLEDIYGSGAGMKGIGSTLGREAESTASKLPELTIGEGSKTSNAVPSECTTTDSDSKSAQPNEGSKGKTENDVNDPGKTKENEDGLNKPMDCGIDPIESSSGEGAEMNAPQKNGTDSHPVNKGKDEPDHGVEKPAAGQSDDVSIPTAGSDPNAPREMGCDAGMEKEGSPNDAFDTNEALKRIAKDFWKWTHN